MVNPRRVPTGWSGGFRKRLINFILFNLLRRNMPGKTLIVLRIPQKKQKGSVNCRKKHFRGVTFSVP
jgi:hypothetical protein